MMNKINYEILQDITCDNDLCQTQELELYKTIRLLTPYNTNIKSNQILCSCGHIAFDFNKTPTWMKHGHCWYCGQSLKWD